MNKTLPSLAVGFVLAALHLACSSSSSDGSGSAGAAHAGATNSAGSDNAGGSSGSPAAGGAEHTGGTGGGALEPPMIESVEPLEGGLHVMWMNKTKDCDKIVLLRNKDGGAFTVAYTLNGAADSQHDGQATAPGTYCYKGRCVKGSDTSPDSEEKCGTP